MTPRRSYDDTLPTAHTTLRTGYVRVLVFCRSCRHQADADLQRLVDTGLGDVPLTPPLHQPIARAFRVPRYPISPRAPNPSSKSAQVEGSGAPI